MEFYATHKVGQYFFTLQHFDAPALDLMARLSSQQRREAINALKGKFSFREFFRLKHFFKNCGLIVQECQIKLEVDKVIYGTHFSPFSKLIMCPPNPGHFIKTSNCKLWIHRRFLRHCRVGLNYIANLSK